MKVMIIKIIRCVPSGNRNDRNRTLLSLCHWNINKSGNESNHKTLKHENMFQEFKILPELQMFFDAVMIETWRLWLNVLIVSRLQAQWLRLTSRSPTIINWLRRSAGLTDYVTVRITDKLNLQAAGQTVLQTTRKQPENNQKTTRKQPENNQEDPTWNDSNGVIDCNMNINRILHHI